MMKIMIEETGKVKEIILIDPKTKLDWSTDFIGNNLVNAEYKYSEEEDVELLVLNQEDFDWWVDVMAKYESVAFESKEFFDSLDNSDASGLALETYLYYSGHLCDLEFLPDTMKIALNNAKHVYDEKNNCLNDN